MSPAKLSKPQLISPIVITVLALIASVAIGGGTMLLRYKGTVQVQSALDSQQSTEINRNTTDIRQSNVQHKADIQALRIEQREEWGQARGERSELLRAVLTHDAKHGGTP